jgi:YHS domain-containing protein
MAIDPICKMEVDEKTAKHTSDYKGKKYYFCGSGCKTKFDLDPEKYVKPLSSGGCCCCGQ